MTHHPAPKIFVVGTTAVSAGYVSVDGASPPSAARSVVPDAGSGAAVLQAADDILLDAARRAIATLAGTGGRVVRSLTIAADGTWHGALEWRANDREAMPTLESLDGGALSDLLPTLAPVGARLTFLSIRHHEAPPCPPPSLPPA